MSCHPPVASLHRHGSIPTLLFAAIGLAMLVRASHAQVVNESFVVANGQVRAMASSGNTMYLGGDFTQLGPATGSGVPVAADTGVPQALPKIDGSVSVVLPDGVGGWYVGGNFTRIGGQTRLNLARLAADFSVTTWNPGPTNSVYALCLSGNRLYVGGGFTSIAGQSRSRIAAFDVTTGALQTWNPGADGLVFAIASRGGC